MEVLLDAIGMATKQDEALNNPSMEKEAGTSGIKRSLESKEQPREKEDFGIETNEGKP